MKIEMGESLVYSWLRHVKECQIAQTNWKTSSGIWKLHNEVELSIMFDEINDYFFKAGQGNLFKKTSNLTQLLKQGECDALGLAVENGNIHYYAVDVAFHEGGLNYGSKKETILKVVAKSVRTAFCLHAYFDAKEAEIIFASPFASLQICTEVKRYLDDLNQYFSSKGLAFQLDLVCNDDFNNQLLEPVLVACKTVADTSELFARAYKLIDMFTIKKHSIKGKTSNGISVITPSQSTYTQMKAGLLARTALRNVIASGKLSKTEIVKLQDKAYCSSTFNVGYPVLSQNREPARYYAEPVNVGGVDYYICNDWYDRNKNMLITWLEKNP
jgi:hypothetical protein